MKKPSKPRSLETKLGLDRQTVRVLAGDQLASVGGASALPRCLPTHTLLTY